ncbi:MAG: HEPN domain-containing protein [Deltaproteobacteria bacterium]|jgi:HEPN domain-containing protein|nr:HEPN domain-containing protein [Deltaproteobacteria bacterium]
MRYALLARLSQLYICGRYPDAEGEICFNAEKDEAQDLLAQTKEAYQWLLKSMPMDGNGIQKDN